LYVRSSTISTLFPYTTLFRSGSALRCCGAGPSWCGSVCRRKPRILPGSAVRVLVFRIVPVICWSPQQCLHKETELWVPQPVLLRSEEHTSELQSLAYLVCRLL